MLNYTLIIVVMVILGKEKQHLLKNYQKKLRVLLKHTKTGMVMKNNNRLKKFRDRIKANRLDIVRAGIATEPVVNSWAYTDRVPTRENAEKLATFFKCDIKEIPHWMIV